ncbi:hypothetical protein WN48_10616 [Eufriesea mexicana]|uniref:DUF4794 domain-containing protein n=1 Tax=Eufriesea mexicana TaxID=516756 RepID=A0A310S8Z8_9HYME|nr:hypothetical protein WN48_10616 [Eufriesea mexicana]
MQFGILFVTVAVALLQSGYGVYVSIRMPYLNPAGVTYINNIEPQAQLAYSVPGKIEAQHIGYAAAQVPALAAVPYVKHVPTVSHVPVTKIEAQPALLEKQLDVVKPAVSTRKYEVRRPAIQKQFFDIEERVVVRPAGSAVVELDQPTSKTQKGPALIQPLFQQFEAAPTLPSQIASASPSANNDETVVVENPELRNLGIQNQFSNQNQFQNQNQVGATPSFPPQGRTSLNSAPSTEPFVAHDPSPSVVVSPKSSPEEDKQNQNRLIELLTARGNVAEVGFGRNGVSQSVVRDAAQVRGRQPTFIKTARLDHVQVHSSVPVVGKALAPTVAHAAVPVYQKTISPAYEYYH